MMAEHEHESAAHQARRLSRRVGHGQTIQRVVGAIYLSLAIATMLFALVTWLTGRLNAINLLVFALAIAGTVPVGLLALRGDYPAAGRMDEGQREMNLAAQSNAFHVAYFGLYVLFFGALS